MNYDSTIKYLYACAPLFQNVGKDAYKEGLETTLLLDAHFGHPHHSYKTIHIAGTNGKGSCSHTIAAILQSAGYKVGLYTSPHLVDFRERIRVNGRPITKQRVIDFVKNEKAFFEPLHPSFFELTTALALLYFKEQKVDVAVIEVGLGGRLDCTNIIHPLLSIITNISFDHTNLLGNTLAKIAWEKAGIIKHDVPVCIGEYTAETRPVFDAAAKERETRIIYAEDSKEVLSYRICKRGGIDYTTQSFGHIHGELGGIYQKANTNTILHAVSQLRQVGLQIEQEHISKGFAKVCSLTHLVGRWQKLSSHPRTYCDTGHNIAGIQYITNQLLMQDFNQLHIVFGMVNDKDINGVLEILPRHAQYYFCQASVKRSLDSSNLAQLAWQHKLKGRTFPTVAAAYEAARKNATDTDYIYIGGSSYVVADLLTYIKNCKKNNAGK